MRPRHFVTLVALCGTVALAGWGAARLELPEPSVASAAMSVGDRATADPELPASTVAPAAGSLGDAATAHRELLTSSGAPAAMSLGEGATADPDSPEPAFVLAGVSASEVPVLEAPLPDTRPTPPPERRLQLASLSTFDPVKEYPKPAVRPVETPYECLVSELSIDEYLWSLYERTLKVDTMKVRERIKVTVEHKGKARTVTKTVTRLVDNDFTWKDPAAAQRADMSLMEYVIGGMDPSFKPKLYHALRALDDAGLMPGITSAFRDDYRQSLVSGLKAATDSSYHGGSRRGGYGHGLAADIVSVKGKTRSERWNSNEALWKWIDAHEKELGIGRPYRDRDPPHVGPIDGREYAVKRGHAKGVQKARLEANKRRLAASNDPRAPKVLLANADQSGIASVYSYGRTASGERVQAGAMTAAHRSLPFGTRVRVTNRHTGRSVVVRINDRGPFVRGRVIDITPAAAHAIGFSSLAPVSLTVIGTDPAIVGVDDDGAT